MGDAHWFTAHWTPALATREGGTPSEVALLRAPVSRYTRASGIVRFVLLLAGLSVHLVVPSVAHAAITFDVIPSITGAGTLSYSLNNSWEPRRPLEPSSCTSDNQDERVTSTCAPVIYTYPCQSGDCIPMATITVTAAASPTPANNWRFVRWDGCDWVSGPSNAECNLSGVGPTRSTPKAVFEDVQKPTVTTLVEEFSNETDRQVTFRLAADEGNVECRIDSETSFARCSSGLTRVFAEGSHTITVRAVDASDTIGDAQVRTFVVVDTALGSVPSTRTNSRSAHFTYSSLAGMHYECSLDGATFSACGSGGSASTTLDGLGEGDHTFRVRARHADGWFDHVPASHTWTVDVTPPDTEITGGPMEGAVLSLPTVTFTYRAGTGDLSASFACSVDGSGFRPCPASTLVLTDLGIGEHGFEVRARDAAGNDDPTPATRRWRIVAIDADGDGVNPPADCDDYAPSVFPGRPEAVNNEVDENCDGIREYDRDGDRVRADSDCDDNDGARTPGKYDIPGNGIDDDCDGRDSLKFMTISLGVAADWTTSRKHTRVMSLTLSGAPRGSRAIVECRGRKCPRKKFSVLVTRLQQPLKPFRGARLRAGTIITATVSRTGYMTALRRVRFRASRSPVSSAQLCLPPASVKPAAC